MNEDDLIAAGFHRVPLESKPPKIKWGELYKRRSDARKIEYLEKLAAAMNHAAHLIQKERNQLTELCQKKEEQLTKMAEAMRANDAMLQHEVTRMNELRQSYNKQIAGLNTQVRDLKNGHNY